MMKEAELKHYLDEKLNQFNRPAFIADDPIRIPHRFSLKEDIEIAGFLTALIAWGKRELILRSAERLMQLMENEPYQFLAESAPREFKRFENFVHRTFNGQDCVALLKGLRHIYLHKGGLEAVMAIPPDSEDVREAIHRLRNAFTAERNFPARTHKHLADPLAGSAAKRINMFLRWMVRKDKAGVDFGIWSGILPRQLICPLDVHTGKVSRSLGLLKRRQNDWQAAAELTAALRRMDPFDPVKYDIALFGLGVEGLI